MEALPPSDWPRAGKCATPCRVTIHTTIRDRLRRILVAVALVVLAGVAVALPPDAGARTATITILCTADLHGCIHSTPGRYLEHNTGSLLRLATIIRQVRAETPNVLLLDAGDVFQGTAESLLSGGEAMAVPMNALGYDAIAVGNHEFDWGVAEAGRLLSLFDAPVLAANLLRGRSVGSGEFSLSVYPSSQPVFTAFVAVPSGWVTVMLNFRGWVVCSATGASFVQAQNARPAARIAMIFFIARSS